MLSPVSNKLQAINDYINNQLAERSRALLTNNSKAVQTADTQIAYAHQLRDIILGRAPAPDPDSLLAHLIGML